MKLLKLLPAVLLPVPLVSAAPDAADIIFAGEAYAAERAALTRDHIFANLWGVTNDAFPFETVDGGVWRFRHEATWPAGFYGGIFWHFADLTGDEAWADPARQYTDALSAWRTRANDHDIGFNLLTTFGRAYSVEGDAQDRTALVTGANTFSTAHWMEVVGSLWSFNFNNSRTTPSGSDRRVGPIRQRQNVIIDTAMNIELLFQGARYSDDPLLWDRGLSHMRNVVRDMIREDGGNIQVVDYWLTDRFENGELVAEAGSFRGAYAWQGLSNESAWSRGQGWAIHGLASAFRETGDPIILEGLLRAADFYIRETPEDGVPWWDFDAPRIDPADWVGTGWEGADFLARDSSAAAITAAGLLELSRLLDDPALRQHYFDYAEQILVSLSTPDGDGGYLSQGTGFESILTKGTYSFTGYNKGLPWGDFYYIQALQRYREIVDPFPMWGSHTETARTARWGALPAHVWTVRSHAGRRALGTVHGLYANGVDGDARAVALHDEPVEGDFSFAVDFVSDENFALRPDASAKIVFDWINETEYHFLLLSATGFASGIYRVQGDHPSFMIPISGPLITNHEWQRVEIARSGNTYSITLDGETLFDGIYNGAPRSGLVGVGSLGHSAYFASPELEIASPTPTNFATWAAANIPNPADRAPTADGNGNGLANLLDYILGGPGPAIQVMSLGDGLTEVRFPSRARSDVDVFLEASEDLVNWRTVRTGSPLLHQPGPDGRRSITATAPAGTFFRLRAEFVED
jgi:unsaturated chondroitin disaccharide hydrolase